MNENKKNDSSLRRKINTNVQNVRSYIGFLSANKKSLLKHEWYLLNGMFERNYECGVVNARIEVNINDNRHYII